MDQLNQDSAFLGTPYTKGSNFSCSSSSSYFERDTYLIETEPLENLPFAHLVQGNVPQFCLVSLWI